MAGREDGEYVICPYCDEKHGDAWEWAAKETEGRRMECQGCGKTFVFWAEHDTIFRTRDTEGGELLKAALGHE